MQTHEPSDDGSLPTDHFLWDELRSRAEVRQVLSFDIVGSSALKIGDIFRWREEVEGRFYDGFPRLLREIYDGLGAGFRNACHYLQERPPIILKTEGDKLVFHTPLLRHEHSVAHLWVAKEAVNAYNTAARKDNGLPLRVVSWLVGCPITDHPVAPREGCLGIIPADYIGPSMDAGARLEKVALPERLAQPSRLVVAPELALMALDAMTASEVNDFGLFFYFAGCGHLEGISTNYPFVWINTLPGNQHPIQDILQGGRRHQCDPTELRDYLRRHQKESGNLPWFIKTDDSPLYQGPTRPWLERFAELWEHEQAKSRM